MNKIEWIEKYLANAERMMYENQVDEGLRLLNGLLYEEPGYSNLHNYLGWAYMYYTQESAKAELHLKMAIHFANEYAAPYLHMGALLNRAGRYTEAISYFQQGLMKANANKVALLEGMAYAHEMKSDYSQAIQVYKEGVQSTALQHEVERMAQGVKRCRKKQLTFLLRSGVSLSSLMVRRMLTLLV